LPIPGLELALRHSHQGERLQAKCTWKFGFGFNGRPGSLSFGTIPGQANLIFDIEILEVFSLPTPPRPYLPLPRPQHIRSPDNGDMDLQSIVRDVAVRKENGNRWFAYGDFTKAGRCFSQGGKTGDGQLDLLSQQLDDSPTGRAGRELLGLYLDCLNNLSACHLNMGDPFKARESCIRVLEIDPNNQRGLLRASKYAPLSLSLPSDLSLSLSLQSLPGAARI
jgi:tetratricopeptide (TPR) repeat protein